MSIAQPNMNPSTSRRSGDEVFADWLGEQRKLSERNTAVHRRIWSLWLRWLSEPGSTRTPRAESWQLATAADVRNYIANGISARPRGSVAPGKVRRAKVATVTAQRRYWRVLERIYEHALKLGEVSSNPVSRREGERVSPAGRSGKHGALPGVELTESATLSADVWERIEQIEPRGGPEWQQLRDSLILRCFTRLALTPAEVCALRCDDLLLRDLNTEVSTLKVSRGRDHQIRVLHMPYDMARDFMRWVEMHAILVPGVAGVPDRDNWLFVSNRLKPVGYPGLFDFVSRQIRRATAEAGHKAPMHVGPMVLRNTRIVRWHKGGMALDALLKNAGLKDEESLRGLRAHITIDAAKLRELAKERMARTRAAAVGSKVQGTT